MTEKTSTVALRALRLNFETVASVVAMVVGLCALFVAWDQAQIMRRQQHASVLPLLNIAAGMSMEENNLVFRLTVSNAGIGPALIEAARLKIDGRAIASWEDLRDGLLPPTLRENYSVSLDSAQGVLAAGASSELMRISWPDTDAADAGFRDLRRRIIGDLSAGVDFEICYCSAFGRCWLTAREFASRPAPTKSCAFSGDIIAIMLETISDQETDEK